MVAPLPFRAISCDLPRKLWKAVVTAVDGNEKKQIQSCKKAVETPFREPDEHKEKVHLGIEAKLSHQAMWELGQLRSQHPLWMSGQLGAAAGIIDVYGSRINASMRHHHSKPMAVDVPRPHFAPGRMPMNGRGILTPMEMIGHQFTAVLRKYGRIRHRSVPAGRFDEPRKLRIHRIEAFLESFDPDVIHRPCGTQLQISTRKASLIMSQGQLTERACTFLRSVAGHGTFADTTRPRDSRYAASTFKFNNRHSPAARPQMISCSA
ncbi:hypothetical protein FB45DRAFT_1014837 [Roridomyces roridus]|uniref:Uncharacterized protein n=1 Tax=Roridomyces roridus TaxID=1738132 RepID=A0AAD7AXD9_9AGAR|nr:hypothetical protein FB45DRAFT_1014837 [Roridomyces roridus]